MAFSMIRLLIEQARLLTLHAARRMDAVGNKLARTGIAMIKVAVPDMATARLLRQADGPDEVHRNQIGKWQLARYE